MLYSQRISLCFYFNCLSFEKGSRILVKSKEPIFSIRRALVVLITLFVTSNVDIRHFSSLSWLPCFLKPETLLAGSVNGSNSSDLAKKEDIDGFLVGGASLKVI